MFRRKRSDADFQAEMEAHIELEAARLREQGLPEQEARAAARRAFGNRTASQERFHERGRWLFLDSLGQDLRLALRLLATTPAWTAVAALTAALGIGASVAMFSVAYAVLLKPLPYQDADRLYWINDAATIRIATQFAASTREFAEVAAWDFATPTWFTADGPRALRGAWVTARFFSVFQVQPLLGRTFRPEEEATQGVAVISYGLWQRAFAGDPAIVGRTIRLAVRQQMPITIVGVLPPQFDFPNHRALPGAAEETWSPDVWVPWPVPLTLGNGAIVCRIIARARPDATAERIAADVARFGASYQEFPAREGAARRTFAATRLQDRLAGTSRTALLIFSGAVAILLLILCFNIASLLLARATTRQREIAVRVALGAPRRRIVQQLLTESLLIAGAGGLLGVGLARGALAVFNSSQQLVALALPEIAMDHWTAAFAVALTVVTGLAFGLAPSLGALGFGVRDALQRDTLTLSTSGGLRRSRQLLVVVQLGFSLTMLIGAGLLGKSLLQIVRTDPGFDPRNLVTATRVSIRPSDQAGLIAQLRALPGVASVALSSAAPGTSAIGGMDFFVQGRPQAREHTQIIVVSPAYFRTLAVPLRKGRLFTAPEAGSAPVAAVVNASFARRFFPDQDPLGQRIQSFPLPNLPGLAPDSAVSYRIVGVVGDIRQHELEREPELMVYAQLASDDSAGPVVRTQSDAAPLLPAIRKVVASYTPNRPPPEVDTVERRFANALSPRRFNAVLIGALALAATFLAAIGVYGVMSYLVARRAKEIGIRMALGARPANVLAMIVKEGAALGVLGAVLGLAGAAALTRYLAALLLNVSPYDQATFAGFTALLLLVALAACYLPGRRAAAADPLTVLRHE